MHAVLSNQCRARSRGIRPSTRIHSLAPLRPSTLYPSFPLTRTPIPHTRRSHTPVPFPFPFPLRPIHTLPHAPSQNSSNFENPNLIGMLQRGVKKIVMFANFEHPLKPKEDWDPAARAPTDDDLDNDIPAFFGIFTEKNSSTGIFINKNQVGREVLGTSGEVLGMGIGWGRGRVHPHVEGTAGV
jgi:hypothetical protein